MSQSHDPAVSDWIAQAQTVPLMDALRRAAPAFAASMHKAGVEMVASCMACCGTGGKSGDGFSVHGAKRKWHCRKFGSGGQKPAGMVMHVLGCDFFAAIEAISGVPNPRGKPMSDEERRAAKRRSDVHDARFQGQQHFARAEARGAPNAPPDQFMPDRLADDAGLRGAFIDGWKTAHSQWRTAERYRERDRGRAEQMWQSGLPFAASPLPHYFAHRRILSLPPGIALRYHGGLPLVAAGDTVLHRGPCMIAPIVDSKNGLRIGVHRTWLSWDGQRFTTEKGTAQVQSETGEPLKKMALGSKKGGIIPLGGGMDPDHPLRWRDAHTIVMGEGRETVLAVYFRLLQAGFDLSGWFFASSIDLGNIGGLALDRVKHPSRKNAAGKTMYVPGTEPDMEQRGILIPANCTTLYLLRDGDSDAFDTENCLQRGAKRFLRQRAAMIDNRTARRPLAVRIMDAADGMDFDDFNRATLSSVDSSSAQRGSPHNEKQVAA